MSADLLPLFPLEVVLFPSSALPLHIYEERYKVLINQSVRDRTVFGINLITGKEISETGCTATVKEVVRRYEDGRMDIVVVGMRRFRLLGVFEDRAPYALGKIRYRGTRPSKSDPDLILETIRLYNNLMGIVYSGGLHQIPEDPGIHDPSFLMAQKVGLDLAGRQLLLETDSEARRLQWLRRYLREIVPKVKKAATAEWIVRRDGYL
jgi:hypothetical protein